MNPGPGTLDIELISSARNVMRRRKPTSRRFFSDVGVRLKELSRIQIQDMQHPYNMLKT